MKKTDTNNSQLSTVNSTLPKGWEIKKLGELSKINYGYTEKAVSEKIGPKFLRITDIQNSSVNWNNVPYCKCNDKDIQKYKLETGDIVFARTGATTGKSYLIQNPPKSVFASYLIRLKLNDLKSFEPKFILYFFNTYEYWNKINTGISGSAQGGFNASKLSELDIPIPPLPEQKRIVAILDRAFEAIDQAKANAGKNLQNAKELFESYLNRIFEEKGEGWEEKKLKEISKINYGYTEKAKFENIGPKFLRITDIQNNSVNWETVPYCKCIDEDLPKYKLEKGDIIFARTGATTGKSYLIQNPPNSVFASYLIRLELIEKDKFDAKFIMYFFNTKQYWGKISSGISGSAQGGFNATKLGNLSFVFPKSLETQKQIVAQLDRLQAERKKLEAIYQQKLDNLEEMEKSVLQKAFNGEL